jgi:hypothetical protein
VGKPSRFNRSYLLYLLALALQGCVVFTCHSP